ncbi:hypothetical protein C5Y96_00625 [Blastopirellula marina]|uniref:Uncharacterized protein n=1 Tax=Blastopirellula marina TaxID=124 RepID=A0A2S8G9W2_9BACT|nr:MULTISPECIES: hypothetical protein [Pirellulaceae]PQO41252.1 hypothetical protein C5Y96_00625 [Blastopirellula marina]RCS56276.1 hypothetical protein DTL36_00625 [Bremerella cremea]
MTDKPQEETLDRRVKQRLQSRYVRWLARNKPDTFYFWEPWRRLQRLVRRILQVLWRLFDILVPEWLFLGFGAIACLALAVGILYMCGCFAWAVFHDSPASEPLSIDDQAHVGFYRLAVMQFAALLALIPMGISFRDGSDESRDFKRVMFRGHRRVQVGVIRMFAGGTILLSWIAAALIPLDLPSYVSGMIATGMTGTILFWSAQWVSLWLGRLGILTENKSVKDISIFVGLMFCLLAFLFCLLPENILYAKYLAWLGPTGWLNDQARQIGYGNWRHASLLIGTWCVLLVGGLVARHQVKTWKHRRLVLKRSYPNPDDVKDSKRRSEISLTDISADFRNRLSGVPASWREWLLPAWIRLARMLVVTMAICGLVSQGVAYFVHMVITSLGEPNQQLVRSELLLVYIAIGIMVGTLEICGLHNHDLACRSPLEEQPLSPWGLWKRLQFRGLIRIPLTVLCTLPMLIIPIIVNQGDPILPLSALGLVLSAAFALRTLVAAIITQQVIYREMEDLLAAGLSLLVMGLAFGVLVVIMLAAIPDYPGSYPVAWRQLAAHGSSLLLFFIATRVWLFTPWLADGTSKE